MPVPVLIQGETGTGKELVARATPPAAGAARAVRRVNCAALPASLVESELFGHERGAFTGAVAARLGPLRGGHGGTLFLDEIGDLPLELQAKLLRVLGAARCGASADRRAAAVDPRGRRAATRTSSRSLRGRFREDLYYRLNVVEIAVPPLRERAARHPRAGARAVGTCRRRAQLARVADRTRAHVPAGDGTMAR